MRWASSTDGTGMRIEAEPTAGTVRTRAHRGRTSASLLVAAMVFGGAWLLRSFDPSVAGGLFPQCLFLAVTGFYCPGCGVTRALHALAHLDVARAFAMNALVVAGLPVLAWMGVQAARGRSARVAGPLRVLFDGRAWIAALALFGIARNLPWEPFASLAPGGLL